MTSPSQGDRPPADDTVRRQISEIMREAEGELIDAVAPKPTDHPSRAALDQEMATAKDQVLRMGSLVEEAILAAISALVAHDAAAATAVIENDRAINEKQREVSTQITRAIATQSPVARDLRFLLALDHVSYELERMGDHAGSVAKQVRKLAPFPPLKDYVLLPQLGQRVAELVRGIILALVDIAPDRARDVAHLDHEVADRHRRTLDEA